MAPKRDHARNTMAVVVGAIVHQGGMLGDGTTLILSMPTARMPMRSHAMKTGAVVWKQPTFVAYVHQIAKCKLTHVQD